MADMHHTPCSSDISLIAALQFVENQDHLGGLYVSFVQVDADLGRFDFRRA